ncbi:2-hydroxyacid dehydrogenase [Oceanobacillus jeddahense]|uniref:2-hydroxyacid dehydrogenase n=1 Tax=Oceanobacillus jeddahense TaxID=1462527 RepID=A0ABY5JTI1_9BACI|nr:2-hydroxyacid dehydrogenase [Oceanobacillus jeddahense]UUI03633.1 2-hydroxyacid dehydrogenase [Oceanobacillus jeddahense]
MNILITAPYSEDAMKELEQYNEKVIYKPWKANGRGFNEEELLKLCKENDIEGLITEVDDVSSYVIENHKLSFIGVCRANPVNVNIDAATLNKIPVFNTPARNAQAVAELFIGNVISFMRNIIPSNKWIEENNWSSEELSAYLEFKGNELAGKTVGFVGFGAVGQTIANLIKHFPCDIQYYDPFVEDLHASYKKTSLEDLFAKSDIVSIHLPVNDATKNLINKELLQLMKPDAIFVNTARSAVVDTDALIEILSNESIRGAILDVFDHEPPREKDYQLIKLPNVLATPHIAGASYEVENHHAAIMNNNLKKWKQEGVSPNIFNQKKLDNVIR